MTPALIGEEWFVTCGAERIAGPFKTNGEAWRWIDRQEGEPVSRSEKTTEWVFGQMAKGTGL